MEIFLNPLKKSINHLEIIDKVFSNSTYPEKDIYLKIKDELKRLDTKIPFNKFSEELYVGGKKRNSSNNQGYARQMILSDIVEYIINGRGYFYAIRNKEAMKTYIEIILTIVNQLMIYDSISVDIPLRKRLLEELQAEMGGDFFKEEERKIEHEALLLHSSPIGLPLRNNEVNNSVLEKLGLTEFEKGKAIKRLEEYYDSLLPKTAGGLWGELIVYIYILRTNLGFVFPLLLNQRLLTGESGSSRLYLKPPDLLLLPYGKQNFYGIEVGGGKEVQSGNFSIITGLPTATKANMDNPKRCCICGKWMLFCPQVIKDYSDNDKSLGDIEKPIKCISDCKIYTKEQILEGKCPYAMHKGGKPQEYVMNMKGETYHFHLNCLKNDSLGKKDISENSIVAYYPYVRGLEEFENMKVDVDIVKQKIEELKQYLSKINEKSEG